MRVIIKKHVAKLPACSYNSGNRSSLYSYTILITSANRSALFVHKYSWSSIQLSFLYNENFCEYCLPTKIILGNHFFNKGNENVSFHTLYITITVSIVRISQKSQHTLHEFLSEVPEGIRRNKHNFRSKINNPLHKFFLFSFTSKYFLKIQAHQNSRNSQLQSKISLPGRSVLHDGSQT